MTKAAQRLLELQTATGRYERPRRAYGQPAEHVATIKRQSDAFQTVRKSRDAWRARAEKAKETIERMRLCVEALGLLALISEDRGMAFAAKKMREEIDG